MAYKMLSFKTTWMLPRPSSPLLFCRMFFISMDCLRLRRRRQLFNYAGRSLFSRAISYSTRRLIGFQSRNSGDRSFLSSYQCNALFCRRGLLQPGDVYAPMLLFDTVFLAISLGLSGGTTPDLYVACCFTLVLSCIATLRAGYSSSPF